MKQLDQVQNKKILEKQIKKDGTSDEDDDFNPTLAAMESEIKPKVLKTYQHTYKRIFKN